MGEGDDSDGAVVVSMFRVRCEALGHFTRVDASIGLRPHQQAGELDVRQLANHYGIRSFEDDVTNPTPVGFVS